MSFQKSLFLTLLPLCHIYSFFSWPLCHTPWARNLNNFYILYLYKLFVNCQSFMIYLKGSLKMPLNISKYVNMKFHVNINWKRHIFLKSLKLHFTSLPFGQSPSPSGKWYTFWIASSGFPSGRDFRCLLSDSLINTNVLTINEIYGRDIDYAVMNQE